MKRETLRALKLLVEKTHRMLDGPYVRYIREQGGTTLTFSYARNPEDGSESVAFDHAHPDEGAIDALILTFRFFIQNNESPSFRWLANNVMDDDGLSDEWKRDFTGLRTAFNEYLDLPAPYHENVIAPAAPDSDDPGRIVEEHQWTHREIMMVFIYGNMAHATSKYRQIYMRWKANAIGFPFVENMFDSIITNGVRAVVIACRITERELANQEQ